MKCAIVLTDGIKQIMLTPENDSEKSALKMITCDDDITIETKWGTFYDSRPLGYEINECMGGYLRRFRSDDSLMLVLRRKVSHQPPEAVLNALRDAPLREEAYPNPPIVTAFVLEPVSTAANAGSQRRVVTSDP